MIILYSKYLANVHIDYLQRNPSITAKKSHGYICLDRWIRFKVITSKEEQN